MRPITHQAFSQRHGALAVGVPEDNPWVVCARASYTGDHLVQLPHAVLDGAGLSKREADILKKGLDHSGVRRSFDGD